MPHPVFRFRSLLARLATVLLLGAPVPGTLGAQQPPPGRPVTGFIPGSRTLFDLDLSAVPLGQFPQQLEALKGSMTVVMKDSVKTSQPSYEVQLAYTGYTGLANSRDCDAMASSAGYDSLVGTVEGIEPTAATDDDVVYTGTVKRKTAIDYCQTRPKSAGTPDQLVWCVARLTGSAVMDIEITVHGDSGTGAYVKAQPVVGPLPNLTVNGDCTPTDMEEIRRDYPSGESGGSPDGQPIAETGMTAFVVNGIPRLRVGYFPPKRPETSWGLRVLRARP